MKQQEMAVAIAVAPAPAPMPTTSLDCTEVCVLICSVFAFAFYSCALAWPMFYITALVFFLISFVLAAVAICGRKQVELAIPLVAVTSTLSLMLFILGIMTLADYTEKCVNDKDLDDRATQTSYNFDCEAGAIGYVFWIIGTIIAFILMVVSASVGCCALSAKKRRESAFMAPQVRGIAIFGKALGVTMAIILVIVGFVAAFKAHKTGTVDGVCPVGEYFMSKPEYNDLGCCGWLRNEGTCCHQSACDKKLKWSGYIDSNTKCDDLRGLLSCSVCRKDSGNFATSLSNITVCQSFYDQLGSACETSDFDVIVVPDSFKPYCFDSAPSMTANVFAIVLLGLVVGIFSF